MISLLYRHGSCEVSRLAAETGVSEATVRRDLAMLESQGIIDRQWGAAAMRAEVNYHPTFKSRLGQSNTTKQSLALAAAEMVAPNSVVGLSGGTTCTHLAWALWNRPTNIVTNAVNIAIELHPLRRAKVILSGGSLKTNSYELVGTAADEIIRKYNIDLFFFSCSGASERGFTRRDYAEAAVIRSFLAVSAHSVMMIDDTKLDRDHSALIAGFDEVQTVLCNENVSPEWRRRLASGGAEVRVVPEASSGQLELLKQVEVGQLPGLAAVSGAGEPTTFRSTQQ
jgi:DeoR family transcriptional regulator of aga operon